MNGAGSGRPPTVLLVEDSTTDVAIVLRSLQQGPHGKEVVVFADGELAMDFLRTEGAPRPSLMLLDLNLPKKDGWEVLAECKGDPTLKAIPIVVFTTSQLPKDIRRCYELGANSVVAKPFELDAFMGVVRGIEDFWLGVSESDSER